ncbi:GGDEF domain-containing protein [Agrobacterium leguminum]|uniref:GGDEF domain-containing protein n=1 Tax=Agrobacterium leguminum TaxID=2792015 RepID=UPI003CE5C7A3
MGTAAKLFIYFCICALINYLALRLSNITGITFFWPGNIFGAVLALRWRSRSRYGRHERQASFVALLILGQYLVSTLEELPANFLNNIYFSVSDAAYVFLYFFFMRLTIRHRRRFAPYKRSLLLIAPVVLSVVTHGIAVGAILNKLVFMGETSFVVTNWISEQLSTGLVVTTILAGYVVKGWGVRVRQLNGQAFLVIAALAFTQVGMALSHWLTITSIALLPCIYAIVRLGFAWSVFVTGCFMLFSIVSQTYFYIAVGSNLQNNEFYQQIFAHRFSVAMVAILVVFIGDLVSQRNRLLQSVQRHADTDRLTRLYNRHFVFRALGHLALRRQIGIAALDIDDFKKINDVYGHHVGDEVIIAVSDALRRCVRKTDIAARWGGEEFLIILPDVSTESLKLVCNRILEEVRNQVISIETDTLRFTVSVGATHIANFAANDFDNAFSAADSLLYQAKRTGKDRAVFNN